MKTEVPKKTKEHSCITQIAAGQNETGPAADAPVPHDLAQILRFYRHNRSHANILCALDGPGAGVLWTVPPGSPDALRRAVRQLRHARAARVRWIRRLRLRSRVGDHTEAEGNHTDAVGVYILPGPQQRVFRLDTGQEIICRLLRDECLETVLQETSL